ncbi:MAG: asparagine synthase (glutamine-hydrolyzing) [Cyclobacteriaceae bacterium]|nr:asparagine synthase (glutamine-hydrolyzing) [Cyclobacteriaceae bacterium]
MCGIAGYYNATVEQSQCEALMASLYHRGPDDQQYYSFRDVGLIHTRLSIIELSELGSQPYRFEHLVLVFNGELYNYKEVREELKKIGYSFQSNSDTEVLIKSFHCWREKCVDYFIGMFAFSIYDEQADEMYLFRDRVGVKPLYYSYRDGQLFFASELKALHVFNLDKTISPDAVSLYFRFGFVPHHLSIFESISKLEPGYFIKVSRTGIVKKKYWDVKYEVSSIRKESEWLDELEALIISAFQYRMVSDVPVGVFLSGGIDSSLLTAILQKHHGGIHSFTIGFDESGFDESAYAEKVANHLKTNHTQKILGLNEARTLLNQFYSIYDEPFADTSGIPTACVTQLAKQAGMKVVLSADGGDELFGGYTHYQKTFAWYRKLQAMPAGIRKAISKGSRIGLDPKLRQKIKFLNIEHKAYTVEELLEAGSPVEFFEAFIANQSIEEISLLCRTAGSASMNFTGKTSSVLQDMMAWDFQYYLPDDLLVKVDRATMFYGMEAREPFLDHRLVEFAARMPMELKIKSGKGKYLLCKLLSRYVPAEYFERKKQGFSIPIFAWFSAEVDAMFQSHLSPENLKNIDVLNANEVQREYQKYLHYKKSGKQYNIEKMWRILSFVLWWEKYMRV